jgi:transaldolase
MPRQTLQWTGWCVISIIFGELITQSLL